MSLSTEQFDPNKKRLRDEQAAAAEAERVLKEAQDAEDKKNRGNYRCSRCNLPKKGHVCPYQQKFKRRDQVTDGNAVVAPSKEIECQAEIDPELTVRQLGLLMRQGLPESYEPVVLPSLMSSLNDSFKHIVVNN